MTIATLLEKPYNSFSTRRFESIISALCKGLRVKTSAQSTAKGEWIQLDVTGEDEAVALNLLDNEIGLAPVSADKVRRFSTLRGKVVSATKSKTELRVEVGVFEPESYCAVIPLQHLQAQLSDGIKLTLQRLTELFCLHDFMPIHVKILSDLNSVTGFWEAGLSEMQLSRYSEWLQSNLDRLIVLRASHNEVQAAVDRSRHFRDVIEIEPLGLLEHAVLCKLGTEAVGLIPTLGPYVTAANLAPFSPRRIKQLIKRPLL